MLQAQAKRCERAQVSDHYQNRYLSVTALPKELLQPLYHLNTGRSCCVINCASKSRDHKGVNLNNGLSFHRFPRVKTHQGSVHLLTARKKGEEVGPPPEGRPTSTLCTFLHRRTFVHGVYVYMKCVCACVCVCVCVRVCVRARARA